MSSSGMFSGIEARHRHFLARVAHTEFHMYSIVGSRVRVCYIMFFLCQLPCSLPFISLLVFFCLSIS